MEDFVFKVSLPNVDVKTATPEQCAVHSSFPPFKAKIGQVSPHIATLNVDFTATIPQAITQNLLVITHGYNYIPFTLSSIAFDDGLGTTAVGLGSAGIGATLSIDAYSTTSQFIISIYDDFFWTSSAAALSVSYYIFAEDGT